MSDHEADWPREQYKLAPQSYLAALGQVTFVYNMLESMMGNIFERCAPLNREFAKGLFYKLANRDCVDLLSAFVNENEKNQKASEAILYCILCYEICTENRNILMHSIYFNPDPDAAINSKARLVKRAANDHKKEIRFDVPLSDLRMIADQTAETFVYALNLFSFISRREFIETLPPDQPRIGPYPFPEKPQKPRKLIPYLPEAAPPKQVSAPPVSGA